MARPKQGVLAEMAPNYVPELDEAVRAYVEARDERMSQTKEEVRTQDELIRLMKSNKTKKYTTPEGLVATLLHAEQDKCKVKSPKEPSEDGEE